MKLKLCVSAVAAIAIAYSGSAIGEIPTTGPIRLTIPTRMVKTKTLTLRADLMDQFGCNAQIDWRKWSLLGTISARRVTDHSDIPVSITIFETYYKGAGGGVPPQDSIRFYNGVGSVSFTIDSPETLTDGEQIEVIVTADGRSASRVVTVLDDVSPNYRVLSGTLAGTNLIWSKSDGVIHLTGNVTVPSGSTLTINPGTLVMADKGSPSEGVRINVEGNLNSLGTADEPIFFFATEGPPAMALIPGNDDAWGGIYHDGTGTSTYNYTIVTGGGNGYTGQWHLYPPMLRFYNSHSLVMTSCVLSDSAAKMILGDYGTGSFEIRKSLITRGGFGATFGSFDEARAHMPVLFEDTWITRVGRGSEDDDWDGDATHWNSDSSEGLIFRRCIITDIGDDCVDGSDTFYIKTNFYDSIAYDLDDKLTTYWPGDAYANNLLLFACNKGFESVNGYPTQSTMADIRPFPQDYGGDWVVNKCIAAPGGTQSGYTCTRFAANYTLLTTEQHVECGTGNIFGDPLYVDPMTGNFPPDPADYKSTYDYNLQPGSPALTAGPSGERIGWLGFPKAEPCTTDAECQEGGLYDDGNACTIDTCEVSICKRTMIDHCMSCCGDEDCDYGDPCVVGTCQPDNTCAFDPAPDGTPCDDGLFCNGAETCQSGECTANTAACDDSLTCTTDTCDEIADSCDNVLIGGNCLIDEECFSDGNANPANACEKCDISVDQYAWSPQEPGTPCDDDLFCTATDLCNGGACVGSGETCGVNEICDEENDSCLPFSQCQMTMATEPIAGPSPLEYRWKDIAGVGNEDHYYRSSYQSTYTYDDPSVNVVVSYLDSADAFQGTVDAANLKPNFAYQMKIVANPTAKYVSELSPAEYSTLHKVASVGRWWDATTGQINASYNSDHQMQSYLLFDHFETDNFGNTTKEFLADSSFHVLFDNGGYYNPVTSTVNPAGPPANSAAYDQPYPAQVDVTVSAQNEQGVPGSTFLPAGNYQDVVFLLTEESFHETGLGGNWAAAMVCEIEFDVICYDDQDCSDGIGCTDDSCVDGVCVSTANDENCPDDGLFCNGDEVCNSIDDCTHTGDPCDPMNCNETTDTCGDEECQEDVDCEDNSFCNGAETCDGGVCLDGESPCTDPCEQCDEEGEECDWCIYDLDHDGFIGPGDFSFFAGCYGAAYDCDAPEYRSGTEQCCIANFDQSSDSFVGPGDFSGYAGCFGSTCAECETCWGAVDRKKANRTDANSIDKVVLKLVAVSEQSLQELADELPASTIRHTVGDQFFIELWVSSNQLDEALSAVHADIDITPNRVDVENVIPGYFFHLFNHGEPDVQDDAFAHGQHIRSLGGCAPFGYDSLGMTPAWVKVATLQVEGRKPGRIQVTTNRSTDGFGVALLNRLGLLDDEAIEYGNLRLYLTGSHSVIEDPNVIDRTSSKEVIMGAR